MPNKPTYDELVKNNQELISINKELMANQSKFQSFFDHAGISICMIDAANGKIMEFNDVACKTLGYTREEFQKLTMFDIDINLSEEAILKRKKEAKNGAKVFETIHKTKNGDLRNMIISHVAMNANGKRLIQSVHIDVTKHKETETALLESEARYKAIIDLIPDGILLLDSGKILFANTAYAKMLGYSCAEDIIGKNIKDCMKLIPADSEEKINFDRQVRDNNPENEVELSFELNNKSTIFVRIFSKKVTYLGKPALLSVQHDITKEKEVERELRAKEKRFREIVENSKDAIFITDFDDNIIDANQHACDILGYTRDEILSLEMPDIDISVDVEENIQTLENLLPGVPITKEGIHRRKDGTTFPVEIRLSLFESGERKLVCGLVRDITERKEVEQKYKESIRTAEEASRYKSEFLANMSHEIRTPMNGVIGMTGLMMDTPLNSLQKEFIETIRNSADALLSIINDILDFSKIEAGKLDLEVLDFNLRNSIAEIMEIPSISAHEKGLEFAYYIAPEIPSLIKGDPGRLRQILVNYINNAIKFTSKGEIDINISLERETEDNITLKFKVRDTGIGISSADVKKLFQSFHQVDASTTRKHGGTGLGLSISKKLAEMMGGNVGIESELGKGSVFWFSAVFEKQKNVCEPELLIPETLKEKRLLIVDDSDTSLKILGCYLGKWNLNYDEAPNAEVALKLLGAVSKVGAPYDLLITDMQMPDMDGIDLGRAVKSDKLLKDIKMVMLTSRGIRGDYAAIKDVGFDGYLLKPVRRSQLYECIISVLARCESKAEDNKKSLIIRHSISDDKIKKTKILLVEDNIINQKLALRLLEKFGFQSDAVANGKEAVDALKMTDYDLVLMDIQMPVMDGHKATATIRDPESDVKNHHVKIVALTAHAMKGDREKCLESGMDDYLTKPINPNELYSIIGKHLNHPD